MEKVNGGSPMTVARKFYQWQAKAVKGAAEDINVPCGSCTGCCRNGKAVQITDDEARRFPRHY
jgi:hypothetical protein